MSQENVEVLRDAYEAFNRGDFDAAVKLVRSDAEFIRPGVEAPLRGAAALREWMEPDAFEEQRLEPLDFRVKGGKVFERVHVTGRGAGSGIEVDVVGCIVWTLDDHGLVKKAQLFLPDEEAEALKAAGLSE